MTNNYYTYKQILEMPWVPYEYELKCIERTIINNHFEDSFGIAYQLGFNKGRRAMAKQLGLNYDFSEEQTAFMSFSVIFDKIFQLWIRTAINEPNEEMKKETIKIAEDCMQICGDLLHLGDDKDG